MSYSIIGFGPVGKALAGAFARAGLPVSVAASRPAEAISASVEAIGPTVKATSLKEALTAEVVFLAVPFRAHSEVIQAAQSWTGKILIDVTNAYGVSVEALGGLPSSSVIAKAVPDAKLVKAFNHLPAAVLAADPRDGDSRRVIFVSGDDPAAASRVADLVDRLGYSPVQLGGLAEGGALVQARGASWAPLIFQDLFKKGN